MTTIFIQNIISDKENSDFLNLLKSNSIVYDETVDAFENGRHPYIDKYFVSKVPCLIDVENNKIVTMEDLNSD